MVLIPDFVGVSAILELTGIGVKFGVSNRTDLRVGRAEAGGAGVSMAVLGCKGVLACNTEVFVAMFGCVCC